MGLFPYYSFFSVSIFAYFLYLSFCVGGRPLSVSLSLDVMRDALQFLSSCFSLHFLFIVCVLAYVLCVSCCTGEGTFHVSILVTSRGFMTPHLDMLRDDFLYFVFFVIAQCCHPYHLTWVYINSLCGQDEECLALVLVFFGCVFACFLCVCLCLGREELSISLYVVL